MEIIDLTENSTENMKVDYYTCWEEWADEIKDGVCRKECWCKAMREKGLRAKRISTELGDKVIYREVDVGSRAAVAEWGLSDELFTPIFQQTVF